VITDYQPRKLFVFINFKLNLNCGYKDKSIQFELRWTRARAAQMEEEQKQAERNVDADTHIEESIKTNNIAALIKIDLEKWDGCLIKTGPSMLICDGCLWSSQTTMQRPAARLGM